MPFTPYHFGPGLLAKATAPQRVSFIAFAATQVCIDIESLYHILKAEWPIHRQLHSLMGGGAVGVGVAAAIVVGRPLLNRLAARVAPSNAVFRSAIVAELDGVAALVGGLLGGLSHSILDAVFHTDVRPLWPLSDANQLFGLVEPGLLQALCAIAGILGVGWLWLSSRRRRLVV